MLRRLMIFSGLVAVSACATPHAQLYIVFEKGTEIDPQAVVNVFEDAGLVCQLGTEQKPIYLCSPAETVFPSFGFNASDDPFQIQMSAETVYFPGFQQPEFSRDFLSRLEPILNELHTLGAQKLKLFPFRKDIERPIVYELEGLSIDQLNP
ncbi:hypothetical protein KKW20_16010 [Planktotalea lamellibrachiae]|nr:hypothetical protein [Aliiroseovarius lamellibrachiae]